MLDRLGGQLVNTFHRCLLFGIGAATAWAALVTLVNLFVNNWPLGHASVQDLLLLFIYLEIGAMVGIYFKTNHMPVRFLIYIAITAITRYIIDIIAAHTKIYEILAMSGSILILAVSVLAVRMASHRFPSDNKSEDIS